MEELTLRQWRRLKNISQKELADKANVTDETIRRYESDGLENAKYSTALKIAEVLGVDLKDIHNEKVGG